MTLALLVHEQIEERSDGWNHSQPTVIVMSYVIGLVPPNRSKAATGRCRKAE